MTATKANFPTVPIRRSLRAGAAAALAIAAFAAPAHASTIGVGGDVSGAGGDAFESQVAVNASGDAAFAWSQDNGGGTDEVKARLRADNALGAITAISTAGISADEPAVAIEPDGDAVIAWKRWMNTYWRLETRTLATDGTLGAVQTVSTGTQSAMAPAVAVDDTGNAVVAWHQWTGSYDRVYARTLSASGALGSILSVSAANQDAGWPKLGYDANGVATLAYTESDGTYYLAKARRLSAAGTLGSVAALSLAPYSANNLDLAVEDDGDAIVAWDQIVGGVDTFVQSRPLTAAGALGNIQTLSSAGANSQYPEVGFDEDGDAVFAWLRADLPDYQVQARTRTAAGTLGGVLTLSQPGRPAGAPDLAVAASGTAAFTWSRSDSAGDGTIKSRKLYSTGVLGDVSALTDSGDAEEPHVGIDDNGSAVYSWQRDDDVEYFANCCGAILAGGVIQNAPPIGP